MSTFKILSLAAFSGLLVASCGQDPASQSDKPSEMAEAAPVAAPAPASDATPSRENQNVGENDPDDAARSREAAERLMGKPTCFGFSNEAARGGVLLLKQEPDRISGNFFRTMTSTEHAAGFIGSVDGKRVGSTYEVTIAFDPGNGGLQKEDEVWQISPDETELVIQTTSYRPTDCEKVRSVFNSRLK